MLFLVSVCVFIQDRNKGDTLEYSSGHNVLGCSGSFGGCPSVCPFVCMSVHPSVRLSGQTSAQVFAWQLRSHSQVIQGPKLSTAEYQTEYHIEYHWVPKLILPQFHFEYHTEYYWVPLSTTLSTTEYNIKYHWVPLWVPLSTMWRIWMVGRAGCVIALSMPSSLSWCWK